MMLIPNETEKVITTGHFKPNRVSLNEISSLDIHQEANGAYSVYTVSSDGTMRCFDSNSHRQKQIYDLT